MQAKIHIVSGGDFTAYSLSKIANELGISKTTVSLVLNSKTEQARISAEVEKTVKDFCKKVNYVPNIHAQRINSHLAKTVGFLVNQGVRIGNDNPFHDQNISAIMGGMVLAAEENGYRISVQLYNSTMDESRVFEWLRNHEIDGLIYYGLDIPDSWRKTFIKEKRKIVGIGTAPSEHISSVNIDNFAASYELCKHIADSGRKRFMYLSGLDGSFVSDERKRGFLAALGDCGVEIDESNILSAKYSEDMARQIILERKPDVDAVICANDDMAIGAIKAFRELGKNVPREVCVAGGDNILLGEYITPSLTTFDNMQYELGKRAFGEILARINGESEKDIVIKGGIVIRESA